MSGPVPRRAASWVRALAALLLGLVVLPVATSSTAYAHASLVSTDPEQGARLTGLPEQVSFVFSESMDPTAYVVVTGPDGDSLTVGEPTVDAATITQAIEDGGEGTYLMAVKAVSLDGHPITGRVEFAVGEPSGPEPTQDATDDPSSGAADPDGATTRTTGEVAGPRTWWGRSPWVWLVGPACLVAAAALWLAGRRSATEAG